MAHPAVLLSWLLFAACEPDSQLTRQDLDGDGAGLGDCNDEDPTVFPGADEVPLDGVDNDCNPGTCTPSGYTAEPQELALPPGYDTSRPTPFPGTIGTRNCTVNLPGYFFEDFTGDGWRDLVLTGSCLDERVGEDYWLVHGGSSSGVSDMALEFELPDYGGGREQPFASSSVRRSCSDGVPGHALRELTGDGLADLVVTRVCDDDSIGATDWFVHRNQGTGFGPPERWSLPEGFDDYIDAPFDWVDDPGAADGQEPGYSVEDALGGRAAELVVTSYVDETIGLERWVVRHGDRFEEETSLSLPIYGDARENPLGHFNGSESCSGGLVGHDVVDLTGDGVPDLVITDVCDDDRLGHDVWYVHEGDGSGFAEEPLEWPLPDNLGDEATLPRITAQAVGQDVNYGILDVDGDGLLDLVVTSVKIEPTVGLDFWWIYAGTGWGFTGEPRELPLPDSFSVPPVEASQQCPGVEEMWTPLDVDGDGDLELVATTVCGDETVGNSRWLAYPLDCLQ